MPKLSISLRSKLKYRVPLIKLFLVREGSGDLFPVRTPEDAARILEPLQFAPEEHFVSLHLNAKHEVIGVHEVSHGTISSSLVHPREVFKSALLANSYAIIVCHNHPSGSEVIPSPEDIDTTEQLVKAARLLGVNLVDHIIVAAGQKVYSLRENRPEIWN